MVRVLVLAQPDDQSCLAELVSGNDASEST